MVKLSILMVVEACHRSVLLGYVLLVLCLRETRWLVRDRRMETTLLGYFWRISRAVAQILLPIYMLYKVV
jgi:hypothetical protein